MKSTSPNKPVGSIRWGSYHLSIEELSQTNLTTLDLDEYGLQSLTFCQEWISGQKSFRINTSGSTGTPKEIIIHREQMEASARATIRYLGLESGSSSLVCIPTQFIGGRMMLVRGLLGGMHMHIIRPQAQPYQAFLDAAPSQALPTFDFWALVPLQLKSLLEQTTPVLKALEKAQAIIVGGAPVSAPLLKRVKELNAPVYSTYGMTETVSHIALRALNGPQARPYFTLLPGNEIRVDERGCLAISGAVTRGVWRQTNDRVQLLDEKRFEWLGRADHVINSGGIKILVEPLEQTVAEILGDILPDTDFFISSQGDERLGEKVVLLLEHAGLDVKTEELLKNLLAKSLKKYEIPKEIVVVDTFSRTDTGKVRRKHTLNSLDNS